MLLTAGLRPLANRFSLMFPCLCSFKPLGGNHLLKDTMLLFQPSIPTVPLHNCWCHVHVCCVFGKDPVRQQKAWVFSQQYQWLLGQLFSHTELHLCCWALLGCRKKGGQQPLTPRLSCVSGTGPSSWGRGMHMLQMDRGRGRNKPVNYSISTCMEMHCRCVPGCSSGVAAYYSWMGSRRMVPMKNLRREVIIICSPHVCTEAWLFVQSARHLCVCVCV